MSIRRQAGGRSALQRQQGPPRGLTVVIERGRLRDAIHVVRVPQHCHEIFFVTHCRRTGAGVHSGFYPRAGRTDRDGSSVVSASEVCRHNHHALAGPLSYNQRRAINLPPVEKQLGVSERTAANPSSSWRRSLSEEWAWDPYQRKTLVRGIFIPGYLGHHHLGRGFEKGEPVSSSSMIRDHETARGEGRVADHDMGGASDAEQDSRRLRRNKEQSATTMVIIAVGAIVM